MNLQAIPPYVGSHTFVRSTHSFAIQKPSFLTGGDIEAKVRNGVSLLINWAAAIIIVCGTLGILLGYIMLVVPVFGQQGRAKSFFIGGASALVAGVAGLSLASWLYDKMS